MGAPDKRKLPPVPAISAVHLRLFRYMVRRYFRRHFRSVLMRGAEHMRAQNAGTHGVIVMGSHASWWDPMSSVLLGEQLMPARRHYAPMDAAPLGRYGILRRIGIFPVEVASARGAVEFLRTGEAVLRSGGVLWVTPQGRFADVRERPLVFKGGIAALLERVPGTAVLPLALEYTFWDERLPETLLRCGAPVEFAGDAPAITAELSAALTATMDALQTDAMARDPQRFTPLLQGTRGTGGVYALAQRLAARLRGQAAPDDHTPREAGASHEAGAPRKADAPLRAERPETSR